MKLKWLKGNEWIIPSPNRRLNRMARLRVVSSRCTFSAHFLSVFIRRENIVFTSTSLQISFALRFDVLFGHWIDDTWCLNSGERKCLWWVSKLDWSTVFSPPQNDHFFARDDGWIYEWKRRIPVNLLLPWIDQPFIETSFVLFHLVSFACSFHCYCRSELTFLCWSSLRTQWGNQAAWLRHSNKIEDVLVEKYIHLDHAGILRSLRK